MNNHIKRPPGLSDGIRACLVLFSICMTFPVLAFNTYLTEFNNNYGTQGSRIDNCGLCHINFNGRTGTLYGEYYRNNNYSFIGGRTHNAFVTTLLYAARICGFGSKHFFGKKPEHIDRHIRRVS